MVVIYNNKKLKQERMTASVEVAQEALQKQIPKKPIEYDSLPRHRCHLCRCAVRVFSNDPYDKCCKHCGQALDWSDDNESIKPI